MKIRWRLHRRFAGWTPPPRLLAGRVVLVTGAGAGVGRAVSLAAARHGATVVLLGRTVGKLEQVYDEILAAEGPEPAIYPMDLLGATPDDHAELAMRIRDQLGGLHGLVHNAALLGTLSPIEHYDPNEWTRVMHVNVTAPFLLSRALVPVMRESAMGGEDGASGPGAVIFTSSGVGRRGRAYWGAYAVSKFGVEGLSQVLADELEHEGLVRVSCLNPGAVRTRMRAMAYPGEDPETLLPPEAITKAYLYLLAPEAADVHGASLDAQEPAE